MTIANLAFTSVDTYLLLTAQVYFFVLNVHCIMILRSYANENSDGYITISLNFHHCEKLRITDVHIILGYGYFLYFFDFSI